MKKQILIAWFLFPYSLMSLPAAAETTITVDTPQAVSQTVIIKQTPVVIVKEENPRKFEGEVVKVDYTEGEIIVRDANAKDRRVLVKQGMINHYKVGDYVRVDLMADLKEAAMIHVVKKTADFEGAVVSVDAVANQIIVRDSEGKDRTVLVSSGLVGNYSAGDRVRIYIVG